MVPEPHCEAPQCYPLDAAIEDMEGAPEFEEVASFDSMPRDVVTRNGANISNEIESTTDAAIAAGQQRVCCAGGRRPQVSNWDHSPTPQSFVPVGPTTVLSSVFWTSPT